MSDQFKDQGVYITQFVESSGIEFADRHTHPNKHDVVLYRQREIKPENWHINENEARTAGIRKLESLIDETETRLKRLKQRLSNLRRGLLK